MLPIGLDIPKVPLARIGGAGPKIGQYGVNVQNVENMTKKLFGNIAEKQDVILVIDEIGKMELLSKYFTETISKLCFNSSFMIFCTIPVKNPNGRPLKLVEDIRTSQHTKVFEITRSNRDSVAQDVINALKF